MDGTCDALGRGGGGNGGGGGGGAIGLPRVQTSNDIVHRVLLHGPVLLKRSVH